MQNNYKKELQFLEYRHNAGFIDKATYTTYKNYCKNGKKQLTKEQELIYKLLSLAMADAINLLDTHRDIFKK
jgi:hypothetical protein